MAVKALFMLGFLIAQVSCGKNSLTFVIDDTGSMYDDIEAVRQNAESIMDMILKEKSSQIEDIVLVTFNDPDRSEGDDKFGPQLRKKTRDVNELKQALNSVNPHFGGDDCWEMSMSGIKKGLEESRPGSYLFVFTDATAKDYIKSAEIITLCQEKQSQIIFVLTGDCSQYGPLPKLTLEVYKVYHEIAVACSGQVFKVRKDEVNTLMGPIKETIKGGRTVILAEDIPAYTWTDKKFNIDDQTEYVVVSVSGTDVELKVLDQYYRELTGSGEKLTWIGNAKVLKLAGLSPSTYIARVKGNSAVTIVIHGRTEFNFEHGFSTEVKSSLTATDTQPTTGVETHLMVSVQDKTNSANIREVELLNMSDRVVRRLPLTPVAGNVYKTDKFLSPQHTFKIAVVAKSKNTGSTVKRVAKTPVTPIQSVAPEIYKTDRFIKVKEGHSVDLNCRINKGKPAPQIKWYVKKQGSSVLSPLRGSDNVIRVINAVTNDQYKCVATNVAGNDEHILQLDVQASPKFRSKHDVLTKKEGEPATIDCTVHKGNPRPRITWQFKHRDAASYKTMNQEGTVLSIAASQLSHSGMYLCVANNAEGRDDKITELVVKAKPVIQKLTPVQSVMENKTVDLKCRVTTGFPRPSVNWFYKGPHSTKYESKNTDHIRIGSVQLSDAGQYMCVAENEVGRHEQVVQLVVNAPPRIVLNSAEYTGVEGDAALLLPCTAVGHPAPTITWKVDERAIGTDKSKQLYSEGNTLFLLHPKFIDSTNNTHSYVCHAANEFGKAVQTYNVSINEYIDLDYEPNATRYGLKGQPLDVICPLPFKDPSSVRWYKEYEKLNKTGAILHLGTGNTNMSSGNYTCRVSDLTGPPISKTLKVIFGEPPKKAKTFSYIEWTGQEKSLAINLDNSPVPDVEYECFRNGQKVEGPTHPLTISMWGEYTCRVSNYFGSLLLTWKVASHNRACGITKSLLKKNNAPIILNSSSSWPNLTSSGEYIIVPHSEKLQLFCPAVSSVKSVSTSGFNKFPTLKSVNATCEHEDSFLVDGVSRKISELDCKQNVVPSVMATGETCLGENTELMRVGFQVNGFTEAYKSCIDKNKNVPLYTKMTTILIKDSDQSRHSGVTAAEQNCTDKCCYEKIQLVNAEDVSFGPAEKTTFMDSLNSVNYCKPKNGTNWYDIEKEGRTDTAQLMVWSGAARYTKVGAAWTPQYLWKVLKETDTSDEVVIVHENTETPSPKLCSGQCGVESVWIEPSGDRTYCCSLADFKTAFGITIDFDES